MPPLIPLVHWLGTKPLAVSVAAQLIALAISVKKREKDRVREHLILLLALVLIIASLSMRPPSPINLLADTLGCVAAILLLEPAVFGLRRLRSDDK